MDPSPIATQLEVQPSTLTMAQLDAFTLTLSAHNQGRDTLDPQLMAARLLVNGVDSEVFGMAVSNGIREDAWFALPPGRTVTLKWTLGYSLFPAAGTYKLVLDWHGLHDPVVVTVTP